MKRPGSSNSTMNMDSPRSDSPRGATYAWDKFKPSMCLACFNPALQLVLVAAFGSFLFGFCIACLNTATSSINSSFLQCGNEGVAWLRFNEVPDTVCNMYPECKMGCTIAVHKAVCMGGYNRQFGHFTPNACEADATCKQQCGLNADKKQVFVAGGTVDMVRCPGGHNDVGCPSLKWYNSALTCCVLIGATIGCFVGSRLIVFGRRTVLILTMAFFLIGTVCCTCSNSYSSLVWGRLLIGFGVGLSSVGCPTFISEVTPKERRGTYGVLHQLGIVIGICLPLLLGLPLQDPSLQDDMWVPSTFQEFWWRFMIAVALIPTLFVLYLLLCVYTFETPVYYVEQHRFQDAASALEFIHGKKDIKEELDSIIDNVRESELSRLRGMTLWVAMKDPQYRYVILVGFFMSCLQQGGGINVFVTSSNQIFEKAKLSGKAQTAMSVVMSLINLVMTFPALPLIEKMGRRSLLLVGSFCQFLGVVPAAVMYWIMPDAQITQYLAIAAVLLFVMFFALAYGPVLWVYLFEIYPFEIKEHAAGLATAGNWVTGVIMVFVAGVLEIRFAYTIFAGMQLLATLLIFFCMRETKGLPLGESPYITKKNVLVT